MIDLLHNRITQAALAGLLSAALIDFNAFRTWKTFHDVSTYQWRTAVFRWVQGAVVGAVAAAGLNLGA